MQGMPSEAPFMPSDMAQLIDLHVLSESLDMRELSAQCERAMVMHWDCIDKNPCLVDQLSNSAVHRIASGLWWVQEEYSGKLVKERIAFEPEYPDVEDFMKWKEKPKLSR